MPQQPPHSFRGRSGPTKPLSHERILEVCYAYKTLHERYLQVGGQLTSELYATMLTIDREIISWEQRSAKLRYEARRQAAYRADKAALRDAAQSGLVYDPTRDVFTGPPDDFVDTLPDLPDATKAALERYRATKAGASGAGGSATPTSDTPPDTSNYRKSGLV